MTTTTNILRLEISYDGKEWTLLNNGVVVGHYDRIMHKNAILPATRWCLNEFFSQYTDLELKNKKPKFKKNATEKTKITKIDKNIAETLV